MRRRRNNRLIITTVLLLTLLVAASTALVVSINGKIRTESAFNEYQSEAKESISAYSDELSQAKTQLDMAEKKKAELESELVGMEKQMAEQLAAFEDKDSLYKEFNDKITLLQREIAEKEEDIVELKETITKLEKICKIDLNEQLDILNELYELLENQRPMISYGKEVYDSDGNPVLDENGNRIYEAAERVPQIALYYEDLSRGYTFGYNESQVFDSASLIKAPFALALLEAASDEAEAVKSGEISAEAAVYDFDEVFVYTKEYEKAGSGMIIEGEENTEYTYLALVQYLLKYSDNVAFSQLTGKYGYSGLRSYVYEKKLTSMYDSLIYMSAEDGGAIMKDIYNFTQNGAEYGQFMYESMLDSNYPVMIPDSVAPKKAIHKYGWDVECYHDMAVVYDENPYVLVFMSDMDTGDEAVIAYIQKLVKLIDRMHENFYS